MLDAAIGFIIGVVVTGIVVRILATWAVKRFERELGQMLYNAEKSQESKIIRARVEEDNGTFYFYNNDSGEFLAQGNNLQELLDHLEIRKPGMTCQVVNGDEKTIETLKAMAR